MAPKIIKLLDLDVNFKYESLLVKLSVISV